MSACGVSARQSVVSIRRGELVGLRVETRNIDGSAYTPKTGALLDVYLSNEINGDPTTRLVESEPFGASVVSVSFPSDDLPTGESFFDVRITEGDVETWSKKVILRTSEPITD